MKEQWSRKVRFNPEGGLPLTHQGIIIWIDREAYENLGKDGLYLVRVADPKTNYVHVYRMEGKNIELEGIDF